QNRDYQTAHDVAAITIDTGNICVKPPASGKPFQPGAAGCKLSPPRGIHEKVYRRVVVRFTRVTELAVAAATWKRFILGIPCEERRPPAGGCEPQNGPWQHEDLPASSNRGPFESSRLVSRRTCACSTNRSAWT